MPSFRRDQALARAAAASMKPRIGPTLVIASLLLLLQCITANSNNVALIKDFLLSNNNTIDYYITIGYRHNINKSAVQDLMELVKSKTCVKFNLVDKHQIGKTQFEITLRNFSQNLCAEFRNKIQLNPNQTILFLI